MKARSLDDAASSSQVAYDSAPALSEEAAASLSALSAAASGADAPGIVGDGPGGSPRHQVRRNSDSDQALTKVSGEESSDTSSRAESEAPKGKMLAPLAPRAQEPENFPWSAKAASPSKASQQQRQRCPPLRKGKWTIEEEMYTSAIIREFERGMLNCAPGTTLRSFLSEKLHCDPMRITKKFAGDASIGKRVFTPCKHTADSAQEIQRVRAELSDMERRFVAHLQRSNFAFGSAGAMKARRTSSSNSLNSPKAQSPSPRFAPTGKGPGRSGSPTGSSSSSAGLLNPQSPTVKRERVFDSPLAVDHTGALVPGHDMAATPARRRSYDLDQSDGRDPDSYRPRANTVTYGAEDVDYGYAQSLASKRSPGLGHFPPPAIHQPSRHHYRHHPGVAHARQPPSAVEAAKPEESQLLLDFFVKVHERCNTDDVGPYGDDARAGRAAKRARSVV